MLYVQELVHEDFDRRMEFCKFIEARGNNFVNNIVFSNETSFELHGNINQNFRYWSTENSHWMRNNKSQYSDKINVWNNWKSFNRSIFHPWKSQFSTKQC